MNVYLLIATLRSGGSERICSTLATLLAEAGARVILTVGNLLGERYAASLPESVQVNDLNVSKPRYSFFKLYKFILEEKPSVVFVFSEEFIPHLLFIRMLTGFPEKIISRNRSIFSEKRKISAARRDVWTNYIRNPMTMLSFKYVDMVIHQSRAMEKDFLENCPGLAGRTVVINNPVSPQVEIFAKKNDISVFRSRESYILCVARLSKVKAIHYAIDAFSKIHKRLPGFTLKIIGEGPLEETLRQQATILGIADKVEFLGYKDNVEKYYYNAQSTILTSLHEGFPNALVESIVCGTPVISFDSPSGPAELLENGRWGRLIAVGDTDALGNAILESLTNPYPLDLAERACHFYGRHIVGEYMKLAGLPCNLESTSGPRFDE